MRRALLLLCLLLVARADGAEIEAGAQHVIATATGDSGPLEIEEGRGFAAFAEVFWSPRFSTRATATFINPAAILFPENPPPADVDLGTLGMDIYSATARYTIGSRLSGYVGAGGAVVVFGNLDDRFAEDVEVEFDPELALVAETGLRYRIHPRIALELGVTYMALEAESDVLRANDPRAQVPATIAVDPMIVIAG